MRGLVLCAHVTAALIAGSSVALAASTGVTNIGTPSMPSAAEIQNATPMVNPLKAPDTSNVKAQTAGPDGTLGVASGSSISGPNAFGSFGIPFTSTRVQQGNSMFTLGSARNFLSTTRPFRTVGRLTFTNSSGGTSLCSASLVRKAVLVTAAHCVMRFGSNTLYRNWVFTPGAYAPAGATATEQAPFGSWNWARVQLPTAWANGTDTGSGAARNNDVAILILQKNTANRFIGEYTGWMGYGWNNYSFTSSPKTGNLVTAAITTLGYPALLDAGRIMQRTDGPTYATTVSGALQYWQGSNLTGGASGGPWVVNLGGVAPVFSGGAGEGTAPIMAVVGVTSWGSADPNVIKDNYSSRFGQNAQFPLANYGGYGAGNIGALISGACNSVYTGGQTFAQLGYCN